LCLGDGQAVHGFVGGEKIDSDSVQIPFADTADIGGFAT
jgi:hypothetical protein